MRVLIFGRHGQLGSTLTNIFKKNHKVLSLGHHKVDITDQYVVEQAFVKHKPQYVLNAAANTQVEANESDAFGAYAVNAIGAYYVSLAAHRHKAVVVHISTDYVFDGKRSYYVETDSPSPLNIYGASKLAGEQLVAIANKHHYIVRTSALFGDKQVGSPPNFVDLVISSARNKNNIKMVNDQYTTPTYTADLGKAIYDLLEEELPFGIYHIINNGSCSWYEFALYILKEAGITYKIQPIKSSESSSNIVRPRSSILRSNYSFDLPSWEDAVKRYLFNSVYKGT
jgi:dTDP-4-dehydrorhamnose reductase